VVNSTPRPLYPQGVPWYSLSRRLCGPQSRSALAGNRTMISHLSPPPQPSHSTNENTPITTSDIYPLQNDIKLHNPVSCVAGGYTPRCKLTIWTILKTAETQLSDSQEKWYSTTQLTVDTIGSGRTNHWQCAVQLPVGTQLVHPLRHKTGGLGFGSRWCPSKCSSHLIFLSALSSPGST
jgi:hypothetical protein